MYFAERQAQKVIFAITWWQFVYAKNKFFENASAELQMA
jgi:hypothetical protein